MSSAGLCHLRLSYDQHIEELAQSCMYFIGKLGSMHCGQY